MKTTLIIFINLFIITSLSSQSYTDKNGNKHLWGVVEVDQIAKGDYKEWYEKNLENFSTKLNKTDGRLLKDVSVKIFIGTWCGDTKFLVPKFIKSWEAMGLDKSQLEMIALHSDEEHYKQGPNNETNDFNIHRVPTFVFEKGNEEIGRIVERTVFDLDQDIRAIASGNSYKERYQAVKILNEYFSTIEMDSILTKDVINKAYKLVRREVSTSSELNTYGYVLLAQQKFEEAEFVLMVNRYLFPYNPNARDSFGEILFKNGKLASAKEEYLEALRIKGDDNHMISQLSKINYALEKLKSDDI